MTDEKKKPVHQEKLGRVRASIWANKTERGLLYSVTLSRSFKKGTEWKNSSSFSREDFPLIARLLEASERWMLSAPK